MTEKLLHDSCLLATGVFACGMVGCLVPILGQQKWIAGLFRRLPPSTRIVLLVLAVGLTLVGATKTNRTGSVSSPLLNDSQTALRVTALTQANVDQTDTARFLDIDVATNGTVSLVAHRPPETATARQDVVVVATTNLCTPTWFALTNTAFAVGETTFTLTEQRGDGAFAFCHRWTYDADARDWLLEKGADSVEAVRTVRTKVYDATNRVWRVTQSKTDAAGTVLACESSILDRSGHTARVTERRDGVTGQCLYAAKQKCASIRRGPFGDVRTAYTRDGAGRVVAETTAAANCETQMVTRIYDSRGRVTSETSANGSTTATAYSADDRVTTITNADGGTEVTALNADGSVASVTGTAVTPEFTTFGVETIAVNGVAPACRTKTGNWAASNPFRFSSEFFDDSLGLLYYNYRHYNPRTGRWMCHDWLEPFTGYLFVENCVVGRTDRIGLRSSSGPQTSSVEGRDCTYFVYAAHGVSDPKGNLWNKFKSRTYPAHPMGDRYGYWGCGANVFNEMTKKDHPGFELPVELPSGDLVGEMTKRDLISRGVPEEYARGYRTFSGEVNPTLVKTVEGLREFAKSNGDFHCLCKSITIRIDCSEDVRNGEVFYMLGSDKQMKLLIEAGSYSSVYKLAYE